MEYFLEYRISESWKWGAKANWMAGGRTSGSGVHKLQQCGAVDGRSLHQGSQKTVPESILVLIPLFISICPSPSSTICLRSFLSSYNPTPPRQCPVNRRHASFHVLTVDHPLISHGTPHSNGQLSHFQWQVRPPLGYEYPTCRTTTSQGDLVVSRHDQNEVPGCRHPAQDSSPPLDIQCTL